MDMVKNLLTKWKTPILPESGHGEAAALRHDAPTREAKHATERGGFSRCRWRSPPAVPGLRISMIACWR
ncbi:MAG: hypothetical protein LT080_01875 [Thiobacillus sp.]|nr:hypothetical protein [Thiobacillus sp.]